MKIYEMSGSEYEIGFQIGQLLKSAMKDCVVETTELLKKQEIQKDFQEVKFKIEKRYPEYLQHLYGRADGAGVDREAYLLYVAYEIYEDRDYCTDVMIKVSEEESLLGHNEDGPYTLENAALIKYIYKEGFFYDFTSTDALAGGSYSFNQHGLIFTMNYMHMNDRDRTEVPSWFVLRELVEAKDIEDLKVKLEGKKFASGFNMNVIDYKTSKIYTIEAKLGEFDVIEVKDKYAHSNHFIHPHFPYYFSYPQSNTLFRLAKVNELLGSIEEKNATIEDFIKILGYHDESYYNSIQSYAYMNKNITACTFLYSTKTKKIKILSHLDETILCLDYKQLVEKFH